MIKRKTQDESFSDGIVKIMRKEMTSENGRMPHEELVPFVTLRYKRKTVGVKRYYDAKQNKEQIDTLLRTPLQNGVSVLDIAQTEDGKQYLIRQVQYPETDAYPVMDLALEKLKEGDIDDDT